MEQSSLGNYQGFEFWDNDPLELPRLGLPPKPVPGPWRALIGGAGDGALQDFIRITTGLRSAADLLRRLPGEVQTGAQQWVHSVEDQAQRAAIWCRQEHEHAVFARLDDIYLQMADRSFVPEPARPAGIGANAERRPAPRGRDRPDAGLPLHTFRAVLRVESIFGSAAASIRRRGRAADS